MTAEAYRACDIIKTGLSKDFEPKVAVVCGSGLASLTDSLANQVEISFQELPGFPSPTVLGHRGALVAGNLANQPVIVLQGRTHYYEGSDDNVFRTYVRTVKLLGCTHLILTNAAGSLREDMEPGRLMIIRDHINLLGRNPLCGPNDDDFGSRFPSLTNVYDSQFFELFDHIASEQDVPVSSGVYVAVLGPNFETAAEIRAFRNLGADAVGMSTVPEVLVAAHCGLRVGAVSVITNWATGLATDDHDHGAVMDQAGRASAGLVRVLEGVIPRLTLGP